jgi:hypothetical protein
MIERVGRLVDRLLDGEEKLYPPTGCQQSHAALAV